MLSLLAARFSEAYRRPRLSARRIIAASPSVSEALIMAVSAFALLVVFSKLSELAVGVTMADVQLQRMKDALSEDEYRQARESIRSQGSFAGIGVNFLFHMSQVVVAAAIGWRLGVAAGGSARFIDVFSLTSWWALVSAPLEAAAMFCFLATWPGALPVGALVMFVCWLYLVYVFSVFVAEAHGFVSEGSVFIATLSVIGAIVLPILMLMKT